MGRSPIASFLMHVISRKYPTIIAADLSSASMGAGGWSFDSIVPDIFQSDPRLSG